MYSLMLLWKSLAFGIYLLLVTLGGVAPTVAAPSTDPDQAWQTILELASGPGNRFATPEDALKSIRAHLDRQETTLRRFVSEFPDDPRHFSAVVRLSGVLAARGRMLKQAEPRAESRRMLAAIEEDGSLPRTVRADAGFARITHAMDDVAGQTATAPKESLLATIRAFDTAYPADRRTAGLLTEIATLYDNDPGQKKALLDEASGRTTDEALKRRIGDDQRRLARLNVPLDLTIVPWQGGKAVRTAAMEGHVVVILFWASWSLPALREISQLQQDASTLASQPVDFLTVSLDTDRKALADTCQAAELRWPTQCDGKGWEGETVRSLGINALPTVWILDRRGKLLSLNARGDEAMAIIRKALSSR